MRGKVERDEDRMDKLRERRCRERRKRGTRGRGKVVLGSREMLGGHLRQIFACCEFIAEFRKNSQKFCNKLTTCKNFT